ncbi:MAG: NUDIX domain-containing protein [Patescibacteria group bacterium]
MSSRKFYTVVPSSYLFFRDGENILLSKRKNTGYHDGEYSLPAGHIEEGEYALEAAIREAKEETGVDIQPSDIRMVHTMYRKCADHVRADYFFEVVKWSGELSNPEPEKCEALDWFPITKLPENVIPYIRCAIEHYNAGRVYSEFDEADDRIF